MQTSFSEAMPSMLNPFPFGIQYWVLRVLECISEEQLRADYSVSLCQKSVWTEISLIPNLGKRWSIFKIKLNFISLSVGTTAGLHHLQTLMWCGVHPVLNFWETRHANPYLNWHSDPTIKYFQITKERETFSEKH